VKLFVMRHGPAEDYAETGRDEDRSLTEKGRERVRAVARLLALRGELPGRIVTSPLVRAAQTAEIAAIVFKAAGWAGPVVTDARLAAGRATAESVGAIAVQSGDAPMVVGHEPDLSSLLAELLGAPLPVPMDKAMVVALEGVDASAASLRFIVEPKTPEVLFQHPES
jgi:phosphohistidine phosphatase